MTFERTSLDLLYRFEAALERRIDRIDRGIDRSTETNYLSLLFQHCALTAEIKRREIASSKSVAND